jgi:hypothetical protein
VSKKVLQTRHVQQSDQDCSFTVRGVIVPPADTPEASGNLLAPEPGARTGALMDCARVTAGPTAARPAEAGCLHIFTDKLSAENADRPELAACRD